MTSFFSKTLLPVTPDPRSSQGRREGIWWSGEKWSQKGFPLPRTILMWHCCPLSLAHVINMFPGDSQKAATLMWAVSPLAGPYFSLQLLPSCIPLFCLLLMFLTPEQPIFWPWKTLNYSFGLTHFKRCWVFHMSHFPSLWHQSTPLRFLCMASCKARGKVDSLLRGKTQSTALSKGNLSLKLFMKECLSFACWPSIWIYVFIGEMCV